MIFPVHSYYREYSLTGRCNASEEANTVYENVKERWVDVELRRFGRYNPIIYFSRPHREKQRSCRVYFFSKLNIFWSMCI